MNGRAAAFALALIAGLWSWCTFHDFGYVRFGDWDQYLSFFEAQRRALAVYGELPLWNPYHLGGVPGLAHPQFNCLSPFFLPILWFGTVPGAAVFFALHAVVGLGGAWLLARHVGYRRPAALLASVAFLFAFAPFVSGGVVNRVNGSLVPWMILLFLKSLERPRWMVGLAAAIAVIVLEGGFYALVSGGLLIGGLCLWQRRPAAVGRAAALALGGLLLGLGLAAIRMVPTAELYATLPRQDLQYLGAPVWNPEAFRTTASAVAALLAAPGVGRRDFLFGQPLFVGIDLGVPLLTLLVLAVWYARRRPLLWILLLGFLGMVLGSTSGINLWAALQMVPGLWSLNLPMSFLFALMVPLGLLLGHALEQVSARLLRRRRHGDLLALGFVALAAVLPLCAGQFRLLRDHPRAELPAAAGPKAPFRTTLGNPQAMLPTVVVGEGVLRAYEEVIRQPLEQRWNQFRGLETIRAAGGPDYRGEWYFEEADSRVEPIRFAPSTLELAVTSPGGGRLVVNQNHLPGWTATLDGNPLPVESRQGRLSVAVPATDGTLLLRLAYRPRSFPWGCALSGVSLLICLGLLTPLGRRRLGPLTDPGGASCRRAMGPSSLPPESD